MPDVIEPPPAETVPPVAPTGADPQPQPDVIPDSVRRLIDQLNEPDGQPRDGAPKPKEAAADPAAPAPADPKAAPKDKPTPAPKGGDAKPPAEPAAPPADPGIRLRKPVAKRPELPIDRPAAPAPVAPKDEPYKADPAWEAQLEENEREMLADARYAEERFGEKYKGLTAKTAAFLKQHAELTAKPDFDDQSAAYRQWLEKNQPKMTREQIREIETARVTEQVEKKYDGRLADVQHRLFVQAHEPKIEQEARKTFTEMTNSALPDEVMAAIKADGYEKATERYALEIETAQATLTAATQDIVEFLRITTKDPETGRPLQDIAHDPSHPKFAQHQRLSQMVQEVGEQFKNNAPAEKQLRDNKWFVTRDEWNSIRPSERHRFWTFTNKELIDAAKQNMKGVVAAAIETKRGQLKKYNWQPPAAKAAAPAAPPPKGEPPQPTNTPRTPSPAPVPSSGDGPASVIDARVTKLAAQLGRSE